MSTGWICPKCGRALAPWISECPCYLDDKGITCSSNASPSIGGKCDKICSNKTDFGYCRTTACINPIYGGDTNYGIRNGA